jgi:hypothetical protein
MNGKITAREFSIEVDSPEQLQALIDNPDLDMSYIAADLDTYAYPTDILVRDFRMVRFQESAHVSLSFDDWVDSRHTTTDDGPTIICRKGNLFDINGHEDMTAAEAKIYLTGWHDAQEANK